MKTQRKIKSNRYTNKKRPFKQYIPNHLVKSKKPGGRPSQELLVSLLRYYNAPVTMAQGELIWKYHRLLISHNQDNDLTRLHAFDSIVQRHYADCILVYNRIKKGIQSPLLDLGTGAGFPGILLKIMSPSLTIILAEPRPRRVEFLRLVIQKLNLERISIFDHRVTSKSFTLPIVSCITRAFASIEKTLPRIENAIQPGGLIYFMKGPAVKEELNLLTLSGFTLERQEYFSIPHTTQKRAVIVIKKIKPKLRISSGNN